MKSRRRINPSQVIARVSMKRRHARILVEFASDASDAVGCAISVSCLIRGFALLLESKRSALLYQFDRVAPLYRPKNGFEAEERIFDATVAGALEAGLEGLWPRLATKRRTKATSPRKHARARMRSPSRRRPWG
ncbi:MAG: hypothetical protein L0Z55_07715 [Planctomycetes bacterium]|nr:hypothetical protein [Planctomycetota bacterium]